MTPRKRAGAPARKAAPKRAPRKASASRKPAPPRRKTAAAQKSSPHVTRRVTPYGTITVRPGRPLSYTAELKAHARYRFEETPESPYSIAADLGIHHVSLKRLATRAGWVRRNPPAVRDITPAMRLAAAAEAMVQSAPHPNPLPASGERELTASAVPATQDTSAIDRLEAAVLKELAAVELMRAGLGTEPLRPLEAQVTARTLSILTETLAKLRRLRLGAQPQQDQRDDSCDDIPDIDEFRRDLARRIEAFVASRPDDECADDHRAVALEPPRA